MTITAEMRLIELMVLNQDIDKTIEYLGKKGNFQFQAKNGFNADSVDEVPYDSCGKFFDELQRVRSFFEISDREDEILVSEPADESDCEEAGKIIGVCNDIIKRFSEKQAELTRVESIYKEASAFANLQVPYSDLEHLSFLSIKIGKIPFDSLDSLRKNVGSHGIIVPLGDDATRIMAVSSKKGRFALETELRNAGFVNMEVPADFKGVPADVLDNLQLKKNSLQKELSDLNTEKNSFKETHAEKILKLLGSFCISMQISSVKAKLESTSMVYRITGWIPESNSAEFMRELDDLTEGRIAIREYNPREVPSVIAGEEKIPVKLKHGKFVSAFERMIFSYGSPLYGTIDPTPLVAIFFTLLFGIMFGDFGQGMVFLLFGILMAAKVVKVGNWNKFAPIFIGIGASSSIMGLVTGEFFGTEKFLEPFAMFVTGLFGKPHAPILKVMPSSDKNSIFVIFGIFGATITVGLLINSIGLLVNVCNKIIQKKWGSAFFGKSGLAGAFFYWYIIVFVVRIAALGHKPELFDWIFIGVFLFFAAFGEPFERLFDGHRPVLENGFGAMIIGGIVELIEVVSSYLSSSISFVRVGAFALAHAVLGFIIEMMSEKCGPIGGIGVLIVGNGIVIVLEGMIVAIQVIRLQYYEFFSKFFNETGKEFKPFTFRYLNK